MGWFDWLFGKGHAGRGTAPAARTGVAAPAASLEPAVPNPSASDHTELDVGRCEWCGRVLLVHTRRTTFSGWVDCECGEVNCIRHSTVLTPSGEETRHVTISSHLQVHGTTADYTLRQELRYGQCNTCGRAVRLDQAKHVFEVNSTETFEVSEYFCPACATLDDPRRGRLLGHDGEHIVDTVSARAP